PAVGLRIRRRLGRDGVRVSHGPASSTCQGRLWAGGSGCNGHANPKRMVREAASGRTAKSGTLIQLDIDLVRASLDGVGQPRLEGRVVFLGDREPALDLRLGRPRLAALPYHGNEVGTFGVDAAHGYLGLADGHPPDGVAAVAGDVPLAEIA